MQKEFFWAGFQDLDETGSSYFPPPLPGNIVEEMGREAAIEEREKPAFVAGLEEIAISAEALATRFMSAADIATILSQPTENAATQVGTKEDLFPLLESKRVPKM